jgi:hypothetical protein
MANLCPCIAIVGLTILIGTCRWPLNMSVHQVPEVSGRLPKRRFWSEAQVTPFDEQPPSPANDGPSKAVLTG